MEETIPRKRLRIWGAALALIILVTFFYVPCVPWPSTASLRAYGPQKCGWQPRQELITPLQWMDRRPWRSS